MIVPSGCAVVDSSIVIASSGTADNSLDSDMITFVCGLLLEQVRLLVLAPDEYVRRPTT